MNNYILPLFSVAPMLKYTNKYCRYLYRVLSKKIWLYTEMVTTSAILYGDKNKLLDFDSSQHPIALQIGGYDLSEIKKSAIIGKEFCYDEINLNIGCPSSRVKKGLFGACLMKNPSYVAQMVSCISDSIDINVSVKCRIGVDDYEGYEKLYYFIKTINDAGCKKIIIHARKALLEGLSPKQNRNIPPLDYEIVYKIKKEFPKIQIIINGGIDNLTDIYKHIKITDGVMLGRAIYKNPYFLANIDNKIFKTNYTEISREEVLKKYIDYLIKDDTNSICTNLLLNPILGLYYGSHFSKKFKNFIMNNNKKQLSALYNW